MPLNPWAVFRLQTWRGWRSWWFLLRRIKGWRNHMFLGEGIFLVRKKRSLRVSRDTVRVQQNCSQGYWAEFCWQHVWQSFPSIWVQEFVEPYWFRVLPYHHIWRARAFGAMEDNSPAASSSRTGQREQCDFLFCQAEDESCILVQAQALLPGPLKIYQYLAQV